MSATSEDQNGIGNLPSRIYLIKTCLNAQKINLTQTVRGSLKLHAEVEPHYVFWMQNIMTAHTSDRSDALNTIIEN